MAVTAEKSENQGQSWVNFLSKDIPCVWDYFRMYEIDVAP